MKKMFLSMLAIAVFSATFFFACASNGSSSDVSGEAASGDAVSASAVGEDVSGSNVSGSATDIEDTGVKQVEYDPSINIMTSKYSKICNSTNYYEEFSSINDMYNDYLIQYRKSDGEITGVYLISSLQSMKITEVEPESVDFSEYDYRTCPLWVDDKEIITGESGGIWSIPLEKTDGDDILLTDEFKEIINYTKMGVEELIEDNTFFVNEKYIFFHTNVYSNYIYDRDKNKFLDIKDVSDKNGLPNNLDDFDVWDIAMRNIERFMYDDIVFTHCKSKGIWMYKFGDDKFVPVDNNPPGAYFAVMYENGGKLLYETADKVGDTESEFYDDEFGEAYWMSYDVKTGEKERLFPDSWTLEMPRQLCADGDWLYFEADNFDVYRIDLRNMNSEPELLEDFSEFRKSIFESADWDYTGELGDLEDDIFIEDGYYYYLRPDGAKAIEGYYSIDENVYAERLYDEDFYSTGDDDEDEDW